jgi:hypothetical protein
MNRSDIVTWLNNAEWSIRNAIGVPISNVWNSWIGTNSYVRSLRQWLWEQWCYIWGYSPSFLSPVTNWLRDVLWAWAINPIFDRITDLLQAGFNALDVLWDYAQGWWGPAIAVAHYIRSMADVVLVVYDALNSAVNAAYTSLINYAGAIEQWATDWIRYLDAQRIDIWYWVTEVVNVRLPNMSIGLGVLNNIVYSWQPSINQFLTDPGEFVWNYLVGSIAEKARKLLLGMW